MTVARLLLVARGGVAFTAAPPTSTAILITDPPQGTWPSATQAYYHTGTSYFGTGDHSGQFLVGTYDHADGDVVATVVGGPTSVNQHNSPALLRRSTDGRLVTVFANHGAGSIFRRISTNPDDATAWESATDIDGSLGSTIYGYPALFQLDDEMNDPLYLFWRDIDGAGSNWCISTSTDGGSTWATLTNLTFGTRYYGRCFRSSASRLDFAFTDGSFAEDFANVYHMYYEGGSFFESDGTEIVGSPPFDITDMTLVYDGSTAGARFPNAIVKVGTDIAIVFPVQTGTPTNHIGEDGDYIYCRWDGATWTTRTVISDVGMTTFDFTEGGLSIDPADLDRVAVSRRDSGGTWRMYLYETTDEGASWDSIQITTAGDEDRYPWWVLDHVAGLEFIWLKGTFTSEVSYSLGVMGYGTPL